MEVTSTIFVTCQISASYRKSLTDDALDKLSEINNLLNNVSKNVTRFPQLNNVCTEVSILQKLFKVQQDLLDTPVTIVF